MCCFQDQGWKSETINAGNIDEMYPLVSFLIILHLTFTHSSVHSEIRISREALKGCDTDLRALYLHTVKHSVLGLLLRTNGVVPGAGTDLKEEPFDLEKRTNGRDWPVCSISMICQTCTLPWISVCFSNILFGLSWLSGSYWRLYNQSKIRTCFNYYFTRTRSK